MLELFVSFAVGTNLVYPSVRTGAQSTTERKVKRSAGAELMPRWLLESIAPESIRRFPKFCIQILFFPGNGQL